MIRPEYLANSRFSPAAGENARNGEPSFQAHLCPALEFPFLRRGKDPDRLEAIVSPGKRPRAPSRSRLFQGTGNRTEVLVGVGAQAGKERQPNRNDESQ